MKKLTPLSRILLGISALLIIITFFTPVWKIELKAPQYPEGLGMKIWLNNITGQVDIINGLNHYIGMKKISVESFPEFAYMPTIVGILIAIGVLAAIIGRRAGLVAYLSSLLIAALAGLYDFYQWSYDYGHNLDPTAPIQVPGLTYQPPLIGYKNLLNFEAFSFPDIGGLIFFASGTIALLIFLYEIFRKQKKHINQNAANLKYSQTAVLIILSFVFFSCSSGPQEIRYGKDDCQHCKMTIMDEKFGSEILNTKGKAYKFDDIGCAVQYLNAGNIKKEEIKKIYVVDFLKTKQLIPLEEARFLVSEQIKAPMASKLAAVGKDQDFQQMKDQLNAEEITWTDIQEKY